nr:hypothetical protein Iba_chr01cCG4610 [Ipomoea batatas]
MELALKASAASNESKLVGGESNNVVPQSPVCPILARQLHHLHPVLPACFAVSFPGHGSGSSHAQSLKNLLIHHVQCNSAYGIDDNHDVLLLLIKRIQQRNASNALVLIPQHDSNGVIVVNPDGLKQRYRPGPDADDEPPSRLPGRDPPRSAINDLCTPPSRMNSTPPSTALQPPTSTRSRLQRENEERLPPRTEVQTTNGDNNRGCEESRKSEGRKLERK